MDQEFFICESLLLSVALYFLMKRILENKAVTKKKQIAKQALYQWQNSRMIVKNHTVTDYRVRLFFHQNSLLWDLSIQWTPFIFSKLDDL